MKRKPKYGSQWIASSGFVMMGGLILFLNTYGMEMMYPEQELSKAATYVVTFWRWVAWGLIGIGGVGILCVGAAAVYRGKMP